MYKYLDSARAPVFVSLMVLCNINSIETKALEKRSVSMSMANPCHTNHVFNTMVTSPAEHDVIFTNTQAAHMDKHLVRLLETINNTATIESTKIRQRIDTDCVDTQYLIDPDTMEVSNKTRQAFQTNTSTFMVTIDQDLINLSGHLRYARMNGKLHSLASEEVMREYMSKIEEMLNSTRCELHTNFGIDTNDECIVSADFVNVDGNYMWELKRAFVIIRDIQRYMTFLIELNKSTNQY